MAKLFHFLNMVPICGTNKGGGCYTNLRPRTLTVPERCVCISSDLRALLVIDMCIVFEEQISRIETYLEVESF